MSAIAPANASAPGRWNQIHHLFVKISQIVQFRRETTLSWIILSYSFYSVANATELNNCLYKLMILANQIAEGCLDGRTFGRSPPPKYRAQKD